MAAAALREMSRRIRAEMGLPAIARFPNGSSVLETEEVLEEVKQPAPAEEAKPPAAKTHTLEEKLQAVAAVAVEAIRAHGITDLTLTVSGGKVRWTYAVKHEGAGEIEI